MFRNNTRVVHIGDKVIGGGNPILIQSMTNTKTEDIGGTVAQILELERAGCEIIRCTVPTLEAAKALGVSDAAVCQWEKGETMPSGKRLPEIAKLYKCTVDKLLKED